MLEAGLVRSKNTTEILTKNVVLYAVACTMYLVCGYQLMYGGGYFLDGIAGGDSLVADALAASAEAGFEGGSVYSGPSDFFFQVVFVATAMSIVSGAVAERMKLWAFVAFAVVMTGFIYPMEGAWTWGGGVAGSMGENGVFGLFSLQELFPILDAAGQQVMEDGELQWSGFSDFAGSGIVHLAGACAAFAGVLVLGARKGKYSKDGTINAIPGANLPLATLGTFILWMGWFGFNGGSVLKLGDIANSNAVAMVFLNTNAAAAGGVIAAIVLARVLFGKADLTMALNGALAGLVAITAEPSTPSALEATMIGAIGGLIVVFAIITLDKLRLDDPVGAISVHGVVGMWGLMVVPYTNGDATYLGQLVGLITIGAWVFTTSLIVWLVIKMIMGIRVTEGVDIAECGMEAYPEFTNK